MKNLLSEIVGICYSYPMSYRWTRIKELFDFLPSYYELTVIPAIVLGCIANLGWYAFNFAFTGVAFVTHNEFFFAFVFFLVLMTLEDLVKSFLGRIKNDNFFM